MSKKVPVALFAYSRTDHLQRTLEGLKRNHVPLIYAFSDGPKNQEIEPAVAQVRSILNSIDWCEIIVFEQAENLGLGPSIRTGIEKVLEFHDRTIVIEDDIVMRPGAYKYVVEALKNYENESKVMTISMWNHPMLLPPNNYNGFFSRRFVCWGWATYRWHWEKYVADPLTLYSRCQELKLDVLAWGNDIKWQAQNAAERNLWYVGFALVHFLHEGYSLFPNESLTVNIGRDESGENTGGGRQDDLSTLQTPVHPPEKWPNVEIPQGIEARFFEYFTKKRTFINRIRKIIGRIRQKLFLT